MGEDFDHDPAPSRDFSEESRRIADKRWLKMPEPLRKLGAWYQRHERKIAVAAGIALLMCSAMNFGLGIEHMDHVRLSPIDLVGSPDHLTAVGGFGVTDADRWQIVGNLGAGTAELGAAIALNARALHENRKS